MSMHSAISLNYTVFLFFTFFGWIVGELRARVWCTSKYFTGCVDTNSGSLKVFQSKRNICCHGNGRIKYFELQSHSLILCTINFMAFSPLWLGSHALFNTLSIRWHFCTPPMWFSECHQVWFRHNCVCLVTVSHPKLWIHTVRGWSH